MPAKPLIHGMAPFIDVLIRARNAEKFFPEALASLENQTLGAGSWRALIRVETSEDKTLSLAKKFVAARKKLKLGFLDVLTEAEPGTMGAAYLNLVSHGTAPLVCQFDSDDILEPPALETVCWLALEHPYASMFGSNVLLIDDTGKALPAQPELLNNPLKRKPIPGLPTFRRDMLERHATWNPLFQYAATYEMQLRMILEYGQRYKVSPERLYKYRRHAEQITQAQTDVQRAWVVEAQRKSLEILASHQPDPFGRN